MFKNAQELKIDDKVLVWMSNTGIKYKRYFSHFTDNNKIACFKYGGTSWNKNDTLEWDNWELYDEENSCCGNCKHYIEEYQQYDNHCSNKQVWDVSEIHRCKKNFGCIYWEKK